MLPARLSLIEGLERPEDLRLGLGEADEDRAHGPSGERMIARARASRRQARPARCYARKMRKRLPLALLLSILGVASLGCMSAKLCHEEELEIGITGQSCTCSPKMGDCNVDCDGEPCDTLCENEQDCTVDCAEADYCEVSAYSE